MLMVSFLCSLTSHYSVFKGHQLLEWRMNTATAVSNDPQSQFQFYSDHPLASSSVTNSTSPPWMMTLLDVEYHTWLSLADMGRLLA